MAHPDPGTGKDVLVALLSAVRRVRIRGTEGRTDPASVYVLHTVHVNPPMRMSELACCLGLDASTVSRHVRNLEDAGYLARAEDPDDRRAARVELTDGGRHLLEQAMNARAALVAEALSGWSDRDRRTLTTLITRLADDLSTVAARKENR